ncbi:MAG: hypothetical protein LBD53_00885 [Tannerella sp.]|jgi:hypothetical protein|nr:hypothetical protein [Tannerella sp.]
MKFFFFAGLLGCVALSVQAQQTGTSALFRYDIDFVRCSNAMLTSDNAAGLYKLPTLKMSVAQLSMLKSDGGFVNYYQSDNSRSWAALTESYYRLNDRTVFYGKVEYQDFTGKNMSGSVFLDPYLYPFDITEMTTENAGKKNSETYNLVGAVGYELSRKIVVGAKADYKSANYAKFKDLRHTNSFLDFTLTPGIIFRPNAKIDVGLNWFYRKSVEGMLFKMYGTTDRQYTSLISFGGFYGRTELFGEDGYTDSNGNPAVNTFNGLSAQLTLRPSADWNWYNNVSYKTFDGYYGRRSTTTPVYSEHNGSTTAFETVISHPTALHRHDLKATFISENVANFENIYRKENRPGNRTEIVYFGNTEALNRHIIKANVEYIGNLFVKDYSSRWLLRAGCDFYNRQQTATVFPYYRKQDFSSLTARLSAQRRIDSRRNVYHITFAANYGTGWSGLSQSNGAAIDGLYTTPSENEYEPKRSDALLQHEYEYFTAPRIGAVAGFGFTRLLSNNLKAYTNITYSFTNALNVKYLNSTAQQISVAVGCAFATN